MDLEQLANDLFGQDAPPEVEVASLKVLVSSLASLLLDKGLITQEELRVYAEQQLEFYKLLKNKQTTG